jgi:outer membrane protein insertion porin family
MKNRTYNLFSVRLPRAVSFAMVVLMAAFAFMPAQAKIGEPVEFIRVEGTQRVEAETVNAYMLIREGQIDEALLVDQSVKSLFGSSLFSDVTIRREGLGLVVTVLENPIINRVTFEGNGSIADEILSVEGDLRPRQIYTRARVQDDVERFIEIYRRSGRFAARIEPKVIQQPQNRVDLVFEIDEGPITTIRSINFIGNKVFNDDRLREEIYTTESRWWRFFSSNDNYDPDRVAYDQELLRRFYLSKGYADFRVVSANAELTRDGKEFFITIQVDEGELYTFGPSRVSTSMEDIGIIELEELIVHQEGEQYDSRALDDTVDELTKSVGEKGFAFADIRPRVSRNRAERLVSVQYVIEEGRRVYVERININGNERTYDEVIRREIRLSEGDAFNRVLLSRSERAVRGLNYFGNVEVTESPGTEEDQTIIDVDVREQPTGELSFGVGYSSAEDLSTQLSIAERNFLGRGQTLRLQLSFSSQVQRYNIGYTEPYFLGRDVSAGYRLYQTDQSYDNQNGIETTETGVGLSLGFPLSEDGRLNLFGTFSEDELSNSSASAGVNPGYSSSKLEFGYYYSIDKRNDYIDPTEGWTFGFGQDIAGPSMDVSFLRTNMRANFYHELAEGYVFHARAKMGIINDYRGGLISYNDRFFEGGSSFRGFDRSGVGPRQISTGYALGAQRYFVGTTEVSLPLGIPKEIGMKANLFVDFGVLGETDVNSSLPGDIKDDMAFRATTGLSISWRSPFGPVRFDFANALKSEDYDRERSFRFSVGTSF